MKHIRFYFLSVIYLFTIASCEESYNRSVDNPTVLGDLKEYYFNNKTSFDSFAIKLIDTVDRSAEIKFITRKMKPINSKGYHKLFFSNGYIGDTKETFEAKELGYGISCGFFYSQKNTRDSFENKRLIYKRIDNCWYSYIYFN